MDGDEEIGREAQTILDFFAEDSAQPISAPSGRLTSTQLDRLIKDNDEMRLLLQALSAPSPSPDPISSTDAGVSGNEPARTKASAVQLELNVPRAVVDQGEVQLNAAHPEPGSAISSSAKNVSPVDLSHPLVSRILRHDFRAIDVTQEATKSKLKKNRRRKGSPNFEETHGVRDKGHVSDITMCALMTDENRFLPEWLIFHRLQGIERFILYDLPGSGGAAEMHVMNQQAESKSKSTTKPIEEPTESTDEGLDEDNRLMPARLRGLEEWIEQGVVIFNYMEIEAEQAGSRSYHDQMRLHCAAKYAATSSWMISLDVDEFLLAPTLDVLDDEEHSTNRATSPDLADSEHIWTHPLHQILARQTPSTACLPMRRIEFRNVGIRELAIDASVLETHLQRNSNRDSSAELFIRSAYGEGVSDFAEIASCEVLAPSGDTRDSRNYRGGTRVAQTGGIYQNSKEHSLEETLIIAHFSQRSLWSCYDIISRSTSSYTSSSITEICEEAYIPGSDEDDALGFTPKSLVRLFDEKVIQDTRVRDSWPGKATAAVLTAWRATDTSSINFRRMESILAMVNYVLPVTIAGFAYPCYASFKAIKGNDLQTMETWLMYWIVMGGLKALENTVEWVFAWFPFYYQLKTLVILWLTLPHIQGSSYIYLAHLEPFLTRYEGQIDEFIDDSRIRVKQVGLDYLTRAMQSIRQLLVGNFALSNNDHDPGRSQPATIIRQPPSLADPASGAVYQLYSFAESAFRQYAPSAVTAGVLLLHPMKGRAPRDENDDQAGCESSSALYDAGTSSAREVSSSKLISRASRRAILEAELAELDSTSTFSSPSSYPSSSSSTTNSPAYGGSRGPLMSGQQQPRSTSGSHPTSASNFKPTGILSSNSEQSNPNPQHQYQQNYQLPRSASSSTASLATAGGNGFVQIRKEELRDFTHEFNGNRSMIPQDELLVAERSKPGWWGWSSGTTADRPRQSPIRSASDNSVRMKKKS